MTARWDQMAASERATADVLRQYGNEPLRFGAAELSARARELQRLDRAWPPDLGRWLQDNIVRTKAGETVYADAKFALPGRVNHSIEMRSLLAGQLQTRPVWYICSKLVRGEFVRFRAIELQSVPLGWPCCPDCQAIYKDHSVHDANRELPRYCNSQRGKIQGGSGTPYFVAHADAFEPGDPFGINPETFLWRLIKADPRFWCEACGGTHALSQHRQCRAASRQELVRTWTGTVRKYLSANQGDGK